MDERQAFVRLIRRMGVVMPETRVLALQAPLDDSGDTDCWTHAHRYAVEHGAQYIEGICIAPSAVTGKPAVHVHAWCLEDTVFGPRVVELTPGYEAAHSYKGVGIDLNSKEARRAEHDDRRYSVIELEYAIHNQ